MNIPEQLKKDKFRFVPIKEGMKGPRLEDWQDSNNFKYYEEPIKEKINNGGNYGVVCGYGDLIVIDADDQEVADSVTKELPPTLTVRTGGGGLHFYYRCEGIDEPIRLREETSGDVGDVQSTGKQVVGPGSTHPSGNKYKVEKDYQIAEVDEEDVKFALRNWLKDIEDSKAAKDREGVNIEIEDILDLSDLEQRGGEYYGEHPIHGSSTGRNFWVNTSENVWHCFRHNTGGGPLQWMAVKTGIIDCIDATSSALKDKEKFRSVLYELEKRGLWEPSDKDDRSELPYFTDDGKFIPRALAEEIMESRNYVTHLVSETIYVYEDGVYQNYGEQNIKEEVRDRLGSLCKKSYVKETIEHIRDVTHEFPEKFGGPKHLLACENGIINLKEGKLEDFDPKYIMLSRIPVKYDKNADCPKIKQFISEIVEEDDIKLVQEMFGYCLWKDYPIAKAFMLIGGGANGKSTLLNLLSRFLGDDNTCSPSLQELLNNRFKKIELFGKLANIHADLGTEALEDTGTFKMLTGGDKVMGEKKGKDPIEFYNHAKLIFSANEYPSTKDRTDAFFRRWIVINFPNQFNEEDEETDPNILQKIITEDELSGLLNWAIEGLQRVLEKGHFSRTKSRRDVEGEWIRRTDSLRAFLNECIEYNDGHKISKHLFYKLYRGYCSQHEIYTMKKGPVTKTVPSKEPRTELYQPRIGDTQVRCWWGLDLKEEVLEEDFFKSVMEEQLDNLTQDKQVKLYSSYICENEKFINIVRNTLEVAYPVSSLKGKEPDLKGKNGSQENIEKIGKSGENSENRGYDTGSDTTQVVYSDQEKKEVTRLLSDGLARSAEDIADELDMDLKKVKPILEDLYDDGVVEKKPGPSGDEAFYHLVEEDSP